MIDFLPAEERHKKIIDLLSRQGRLSVSDIVEQFQVSQATARRDLDALTKQGQIHRVRGGALPVTQAPPELPILQREQVHSIEKQLIAQAAAALVQEGDTVFLGSGSTVLEVARNLQSRHNLTVITNSLPVLNIMANAPGISVVALGGLLRSSELSFIGHITEQALAEVRVDKVLIGVHAISEEHGLTNDYLPETLTDRAILKAGNEVFLVVDHTKVNTVALAFLAPLENIHTLVTDSETPAEFIESMKQHGITVLIA